MPKNNYTALRDPHRAAGYRRPHVLNPYNVGEDDLDWFFRTGSFNRPLHSSSDLSATRVLAALHHNPLPNCMGAAVLRCLCLYGSTHIYLHILIVTIYFKNTVLDLIRVLSALSDQSDTPENCGV